MRRLLLSVAVLAVMAALFVGGVIWQMSVYLGTPHGSDNTTTVEVNRGTTLKPLLDDLQARAVLDKPRWLYYYARYRGATEIRAGEYEVKAAQTPLDILSMFQEGRVKLESFTIPEGLNRWQVREILAGARWLTKETFDKLCDSQKLLTEHGIPGPSCEGYLFPETYTFARGVEPVKIFAALFKSFEHNFEEVTAKGRGPLDLSPRELTTLASIVEKETGAPEERPHIACVFYNRLKVKRPKWRLDTDPTVIYASMLNDPETDGDPTRERLHKLPETLRKLDSPYNTYKILGLPPGPIAGPGRAALEAVVSPATCDEFFFVSMNNGRHDFCRTLDCHNNAVDRWQKRKETPR